MSFEGDGVYIDDRCNGVRACRCEEECSPATSPATDGEALDALAEQVFIAFAGDNRNVEPGMAARAAFDWAEAFLEESKVRAGE